MSPARLHDCNVHPPAFHVLDGKLGELSADATPLVLGIDADDLELDRSACRGS
jgi:hypothetical protein